MKDTFLLYSPTEQRFPLFIRAIEPQAPTSWHSHDLVELAVILRGRAEHVTGAGRCLLRRGDVLLIPRGVYHRYDETSADFSIFNILFVPEEFPVPPMDLAALPGFATLRNPASCEGIPSCRIPGAEFKAVTQLLDLMLHEATEHPAGFNFILQNLFLTLAGMLCRWLPAPARATGQSHGVEKALAFLNSHYQSTVTNAQLARLAHLSVAALLRNFAIRAGASPRQYQLALRIDEARALLQSSARPLPEIAAAVGFHDPNYFARVFRKFTGCSPSQFRSQTTPASLPSPEKRDGRPAPLNWNRRKRLTWQPRDQKE